MPERSIRSTGYPSSAKRRATDECIELLLAGCDRLRQLLESTAAGETDDSAGQPTPGEHRPGRFIVLEGIDGAGTTSQTERLLVWLASHGLRVHRTAEPSGGPIGRLIRSLLSASATPLEPRAMALLFAADRRDHLQREIEPLLAHMKDPAYTRIVVSQGWIEGSFGLGGFYYLADDPLETDVWLTFSATLTPGSAVVEVMGLTILADVITPCALSGSGSIVLAVPTADITLAGGTATIGSATLAFDGLAVEELPVGHAEPGEEARSYDAALASAAGVLGTIGQINYSAAKAGILGMTKSTAKELARYNITANAIAPGAATPMTEVIRTDEKFKDKYLDRIPLGRWAEPEEIAPVFLFFASDASAYVTGQILAADGGMTIH